MKEVFTQILRIKQIFLQEKSTHKLIVMRNEGHQQVDLQRLVTFFLELLAGSFVSQDDKKDEKNFEPLSLRIFAAKPQKLSNSEPPQLKK